MKPATAGFCVSEGAFLADLLTQTALERYLQDSENEVQWRRDAAKEAAYYDGKQLDAALLAQYEDRSLPPLIRNLIGPTVDLVLGMEAKNKRDWQVSAEGDEDFERTMALNALLKQTERATKADKATSDAFAGQVKVGLGWVEVSYESNPWAQPYRVCAVPYNEIYWDWRARKDDLSDARYLIRHRWLDLDVTQLYFPKKAALLERSVGGWADWDMGQLDSITPDELEAFDEFSRTTLDSAEWLNTERSRVRLSEVWYRNFVRGQVMRLPGGRVVRFDAKNARHLQAVTYKLVTLDEAVFPIIRLSWWAGPHRLADIPSPYPHDSFPYVPFWAFREMGTGVPYGLIRRMLSPQDEVNSRLSRMYWLLSAKRVIADDDAAARPWSEVIEEAGRPDALILQNPQRRNKDAGIKIESDFQLSQQQFMVLKDATQAIQDAAGVYQTMLGRASAGVDSGVAISNLVEQGATTLAELNDNYASARARVGELLLSLVVARIGSDETPVVYEYNGESKRYVFNQRVPGTSELTNSLSSLLLRVGLVDVPDTPTYRMQQFKNLTEVLKSLPPELQMAVAHIVIRASDLPQKDEMARIISEVTGQMAQGTPEQRQQQAIAQQQAEQQKQLADMQMAEQQAKIDKLMAEAEKIRRSPMIDEGKLALDQDKHSLAIASRVMDSERDAAAQKAAQTKPKSKG